MINYPEIIWTEQCLFCLKALNTTYCSMNQGFIEKLKKMKQEYRGDIEFECEYFSPDNKKLTECLTNKEN